MKGRLIALDHVAGRPAAALVEDGRLEDLLLSPPEHHPLPGAIYRATVDRPMKGQGGVIVRLPDGGRGFLRQGKGLSQGASILVQVAGFAEDGKAVPVTQRLLFKSRYAIATPGAPGLNVARSVRDEERRVELLALLHDCADPEGDVGIILRSVAAETADEAEIAEDIAAMAELAAAVSADCEGEPELLLDGPDPHEIAWREWGVASLDAEDGSFARHGIDSHLDALESPRVDLPGGAHAYIEPTRALTAVDVNTGADTSLAAGLKANIALARALPAQLRCRGLGGQITLDVAPMPKKDRRGFEAALRAAFRADAIETTLAGWTPLGHYELQRRRDRIPLSECMT